MSLARLEPVLAALLAAGCIDPRSVVCTDGRLCPANSRCDNDNHRCIAADDQRASAACAGHGQGDSCVVASSPGTCLDGLCVAFTCGDGMITGLEICDTTPPTSKTCLDYGFGRGLLGCSAICAPALEGCGNLGWNTVASVKFVRGIWGTGPNDIFAAGNSIVHWDGASWSTVLSAGDGGFLGIWGNGPSDVYATGSINVPITLPDMTMGISTVFGVWHWDGTSWSMRVLENGASIAGGVWGSGPNDVFVVGVDVWHWDGIAWSMVFAPSNPVNLYAVWGSGPDDVFVVGQVIPTGLSPSGPSDPSGLLFHWDGATWSKVNAGVLPGLNNVWGTGPNDVFIVGNKGTIVHWDGASWTPQESGTTGFLIGLWGTGPTDVYASGRDTLHWDGTAWSRLTISSARPFWSVWGTRPTDIFAAADDGLAHWDGTSWSIPDSSPYVTISAAWENGTDDVLVVGGTGETYTDKSTGVGVMFHWDGNAWSAVSPGIDLPSLNGIWGDAPNDVFVVGGGGTIAHWDGVTWNKVPSPIIRDLKAIWGSGPEDLFTVGSNGTIAHWDGLAWNLGWRDPTFQSLPDMSGVWGTGPKDAFAVGSAGTILHWDGADWKLMESGTTMNLAQIWSSSSANVFAVGTGGTILHWDGTSWSTMPSPVTTDLLSVAGSGTGEVFAGATRLLLHLRGAAWEPIDLSVVPSGFTSIQGLSVTPARVLLMGSGYPVELDFHSVTCASPEVDCHDGWDNDCDGLIDGADPDCADKVVEQCGNLVDDDGDGLVDCADPDCASFASCRAR